MKVLLAGARGQLGFELMRRVPPGVEVVAVDIGELDITSRDGVLEFCRQTRPDLVINAAAYTAVDRAEAEPEVAFAVNARGAAHLAEAIQNESGRLVQISTDFVFDGNTGRPYRPDDPPAPLGVYGSSKLEAEQQVRALLGSRVLVLRTAWLYSVHGGNFVKTMLRLMREKGRVQVVCDQVGTPTWAGTLAETIWTLASRDCFGRTLHCTDAGVASWYDFAVAIGEEACSLGLLGFQPEVMPISSSRYPTAARRPAYSVLDKSETWDLLGGPAPHWRTTLRRMLEELAGA